MNAALHAALALVFGHAPPATSAAAQEAASRHRQGIRYVQGAITRGRVDPDHGHMVLDHATFSVSEETIERIWASAAGARFSLGTEFAPSLDTSMPLSIGKRKLSPGLWSILLERSAAGWNLVFVDFEEIRTRGWSGRGAPDFVAGSVIEAQWERRERANAARGALNFSVPEAARNVHLNLWLGDLHVWVEVEAHARKGQPAAWTDAAHSSAWRGPTSDDGLRGSFVVVESGALPWDASIEEQLTGLRTGERFFATRMFWTTLVANVPFRFGDVELEAGDYSLALERVGKEEWSLFVLDSRERRKKLLDPYNLEKARATQLVPLSYAAGAAPAEEIRFELNAARDELALEIRYGPHRWSAPLHVAR
jgi:hypothetical protein